MDVLAHHLRPLEDPDAPTGSAPGATLAAETLRAVVREELPDDEQHDDSPMLALPAGPTESVRGEVVDEARASVDQPTQAGPPDAETPYERGAGPARIGF